MLKARDVMTSKVITVGVDTNIRDIAAILVENRISAVPVIDKSGYLAGLISEGDLIRRFEIETDQKPETGLLGFFSEPRQVARDYVKSHAVKAADLMVTDVVCATREMPLTEIAKLFAKRNIKRVPVLDGKILVGIVSRADLVQALANFEGNLENTVAEGDEAIRVKLLERLDENKWLRPSDLSIFVNDGIVQIWGRIYSEEEREALRVAAETLPGVHGVEEHLARMDQWSYI